MKPGYLNLKNVPGVINAINHSSDDIEVNHYENILTCMFITPVLMLGTVCGFIVRIITLHHDLYAVLGDCAICIALIVAFEVARKLKMDAEFVSHIISILYSILFIFITIKFYYILGHSIWTLGFIQIVLAMGRTRKTMLTYTAATMLLAGLYVVFFSSLNAYQMSSLIYILQFVFFALLFIVSLTIHEINRARHNIIKSQLIEMSQQIQMRKEVEEKNIRLALYDHLTGLPNRGLFIDRLNQALLLAKRNSSSVFVLFVDLDMFKMVNDTLGHTLGDKLLVEVGQRLKLCLRDCDTVARIGGDEFLLFFENIKSTHAINVIAQNLLKEISLPYELNGREIVITGSIGITKYPDDGIDVESLVKYADLAMYKAKNDGKNRFTFFSKSLENLINQEMSLITALQSALERDELELYYQPQVDSISNEITGFEALIRWNHPTLGIISPAEFIPVAEKTGHIIAIGEWVMRTACRQNKAWQDAGVAYVPVSVNLSASQFRNHSLYKLVTDILAETGLKPEYLELEITEDVLIKHLDKIKNELEQIQDIGVRIAIDDFGTGYSSIQYLKELPIHRIKIPIDFIRGIDANTKDESIITVILALADNLKLDVIAEGVETDCQLDFLQKRLCTNIQGFYFYKPMKVKQINQLFDGNFF